MSSVRQWPGQKTATYVLTVGKIFLIHFTKKSSKLGPLVFIYLTFNVGKIYLIDMGSEQF